MTERLPESVRLRLIVGRQCVYCGAPATEIDHIRPRSRGGTDDESNLTACCHPCNMSKGNGLLTEWADLARVLRAVVVEPKVYAELCALAAAGEWFRSARPRRQGLRVGRVVMATPAFPSADPPLPPRRPSPASLPGHVVGVDAAAEVLGMTYEGFRKARYRRPIPGEVTTTDGRPAWPPGALERWRADRPSVAEGVA